MRRMSKSLSLVFMIALVVFLAAGCDNGDAGTATESTENTEMGQTETSVQRPSADEIDTSESFTLRFSWADPFEPLRQSTSAYALVFQQELERLSGGQITVELYPAGQVGDQRSSTEQVARGELEMTNISSGVLASLYYPPLEIVDMPFLFSSREHARRFLDVTSNPFMAELAEGVKEETGIKLLNVVPFGPRHLTNSERIIRSPEDLEGLRIRTMEITPHMRLIESLGANAVPIPFLELYTSLQTDVVDGQENVFQNIMAQNLFEVQEYVTASSHVMGVGATLINNEWYESLPDHLKAALVEADRIGQLVYNGVAQILDATAAEELTERGMEIYYPTPAEMRAFRETAIPAVREYMEEQVDPEFVEEFLTSVDAVADEIYAEAQR